MCHVVSPEQKYQDKRHDRRDLLHNLETDDDQIKPIPLPILSDDISALPKQKPQEDDSAMWQSWGPAACFLCTPQTSKPVGNMNSICVARIARFRHLRLPLLV